MTESNPRKWWRLPTSIVQRIHPATSAGDPFVVFRLDDFRVEIRGKLDIVRQLESIAAQLHYLSQWLQFFNSPDFEEVT